MIPGVLEKKKGMNPSNTKLIFSRPIYGGHLNESQLQTSTGAYPYGLDRASTIAIVSPVSRLPLANRALSLFSVLGGWP